MIPFLIGLLLGGFVGFTFMALFQMGKEHDRHIMNETEERPDERKDTDN